MSGTSDCLLDHACRCKDQIRGFHDVAESHHSLVVDLGYILCDLLEESQFNHRLKQEF